MPLFMAESPDRPASGLLDKAALRRQLRARRAEFNAAQRSAAARQLVRLALRHHLLARRRRIGFYMPSNNEIDTLPLLQAALDMGARCYLPVIPRRALVSAGRPKLWFTRLRHPGTRLDLTHHHWIHNRYGIPEFLPPAARPVRAGQLDLLFMPLLGFDAQGWRIGMGGGYYDASLAYIARRRHLRQPRLIGVAFSVQEVPHAPRDAWDVPLNGVLTERQFRRTHGNDKQSGR